MDVIGHRAAIRRLVDEARAGADVWGVGTAHGD